MSKNLMHAFCRSRKYYPQIYHAIGWGINRRRVQRYAALALFPVLFAAVLAGCVTVGQPFNTAQVPSIVIGKTTQDEITKTFGQPFRSGVEDGDTTWTYVNYSFGAFAPPIAKDLFIRFDAAGKVKSYSFNSN